LKEVPNMGSITTLS
jgi:hypothetical protein